MARKKRIGVLTAGGDCPGLNAVIRAVAKTAMTSHNMEVIGFEDGFHGVIANKWRKLSNMDVSGILTHGGTILGSSNRDDPFRYFERKKRDELPKDVSGKCVSLCKKMNIQALVAIGGDGTLTIGNKLSKKGLPVIGVPKTIDNDVSGTDFTFGFDTAVSTATDAIDKLHTTAMSHHRVMVIEIMGRYAGWLALHSGIAGGGDVILIPEIPYSFDEVCRVVKQRNKVGKRFSIIVVSEGAKPIGGDLIVKAHDHTSTDPIRLGGIAQVLARQIQDATGISARATVLGHLQRGGSPSAFDRVLSTRFGHAAADLAAKGKTARMVALQGREIVDIAISRAVSKLKLVPADSPMIAAAKAVGTSFGV